ncbi:MAG TPA: 3-methyl-2-oxobutanoate dehydrogenase subunit VorB [Symbiobacteriaceae bacterium]|nr:3-methyl-2-oxobutanoate dehydrogenase subunit VorB [Symbiobacteriaceae bacterium]
MQKLLVKGNEAVSEAAIQAGCRLFFGYPITPSNEIIEYMARRMPEENGTMVQAESEVSAIYMILGAAGAGERCMTGTSGCGFSLMQEGMSFLAAYDLPAVIVDVARLGPALGNLDPSQGDYFQMVKGGGHGDYYNFVLAPSGVQEAADLTMLAFDLADQYRMPVVVAMDGVLGQMMEPVTFKKPEPRDLPPKTWAAKGKRGTGVKHDVIGYILDSVKAEQHAVAMADKYDMIRAAEQRWEEIGLEDADLVVVAFGTCGRIARSAVREARAQGLKVGMIRPITLWPFPSKPIEAALKSAKGVLVSEMNMGQMIEDVRLVVNGRVPVWQHRKLGGFMPTTEELVDRIRMLAGEVTTHD